MFRVKIEGRIIIPGIKFCVVGYRGYFLAESIESFILFHK